MPACAPRTAWPIVAAIPRLDDPRLPIAETWRRVGLLADRLGITRPSYEQVRRLVRRSRRIRALPRAAALLIDRLQRSSGSDEAATELIARAADYAALRAQLDAERRWRPRGP